jgi:hypothetical protein
MLPETLADKAAGYEDHTGIWILVAPGITLVGHSR